MEHSHFWILRLGRIISLNSIKRPLSTKVKIAGNSAGVVASGNSTKTFSSAVFSSLDNLTVGLAKTDVTHCLEENIWFTQFCGRINI